MEHRKALRRNLVQSLFEHGQIRTTLAKAKDARPFAERLISLGIQARAGSLGARRRIHSLMGERFFIPRANLAEYEDMSDARRRMVRQSRSGRSHRSGEGKGSLAFTSQAISFRLIHEIAEKHEHRAGGYTRIVHLARTRVGDQGAQAVLQLVGQEEQPAGVPTPAKSRRRVKADRRYAAVVKSKRPKPEAST